MLLPTGNKFPANVVLTLPNTTVFDTPRTDTATLAPELLIETLLLPLTMPLALPVLIPDNKAPLPKK